MPDGTRLSNGRSLVREPAHGAALRSCVIYVFAVHRVTLQHVGLFPAQRDIQVLRLTVPRLGNHGLWIHAPVFVFVQVRDGNGCVLGQIPSIRRL